MSILKKYIFLISIKTWNVLSSISFHKSHPNGFFFRGLSFTLCNEFQLSVVFVFFPCLAHDLKEKKNLTVTYPIFQRLLLQLIFNDL